MLPGRVVVFGLLVLQVACGDDGGGGGPADAPFVPVDIDNGSCGDQLRFTGEYIDWDSDASFCGINDAIVEVEGGFAMDNTAPNGRFDLCIPSTQAVTRLDVTQPSAQSQCTNPPSGYSTPTILVANRMVILAGGFFSGRSFTTARQASFFQMVGQAFDSNKAQVLVHVDGPARAVSIAAPHGPTWAIAGTTWAAGDTGHDVFFPNVDVGTGTTTLTVANAYGTGDIPLVAGTITNVSVKTF